MSNRPAMLVDIGSTVIKLCLSPAAGQFTAVERIARKRGVAAGEQVRALVEARWRARHPRAPRAPGALRVCSSASGGVRVGVLGLSRRHSVAAAVGAAVAAGGNVVYARTFGDRATTPAPAVDVLVLAGGVDGADHRHLRAAAGTVRLADFPHAVLVWAGAGDARDVPARLAADHRAGNVLDSSLRPRGEGLAETIHNIYLSDLADRKGLRALVGLTGHPVWPTPAVVSLAAERMTREPLGPAPSAPFVVVDVGGATTDIHYCAELLNAGSRQLAAARPVIRQVFATLGVSSSRRSLQDRISSAPYLHELVDLLAPSQSRALYQRIREGDAKALAPPAGFLACLFASLRELSTHGRSPGPDMDKAAAVLITGGAWSGTPLPLMRRVIDAACGTPGSGWRLLIDHRYQAWAYGLEAVPGD